MTAPLLTAWPQLQQSPSTRRLLSNFQREIIAAGRRVRMVEAQDQDTLDPYFDENGMQFRAAAYHGRPL